MLIYAHRGASGYAPENTIEAFRLAIDMRADGIELDVQLSKDGEVVVIHDETLQRVSDGRGYVKDYTLIELKTFNFSKVIPGYAATQIPTLEEVLMLLAPTEILLNIELKTGIFFYPELEEKTIALVEKYGMENRVCYSSFNHYTIKKIKELRPEAECGVLYSDGIFEPVEYAKSLGMEALHPSFWNLQYPEVIERAKEENVIIRSWTVNQYSHMLKCIELGIDAMITNYPDRARFVMEKKVAGHIFANRGKGMAMVVSMNGAVDLLRPMQGLKDLKKAGFQQVLLDMQGYYKDVLSNRPAKVNHPVSVEDIIQASKVADIPFSIIKAPRWDAQVKGADLNQKLQELAVKTIQTAEELDVKKIIISPLCPEQDTVDSWEKNREFYLKLSDLCQKKDTQILLINQYKDCGGRLMRGLCSQGQIVNQWLDRLNESVGMERFGFCLDMGVCTLCGQDIQDFVQTVDKHIKAVVLRDCDRYTDVSLLPFMGVSKGLSTSDWLGLFRGLREISYEGELILEMGDSASAMSPLLKPTFFQLAHEVAGFLEWQIQIEEELKKYPSIVLFGAGNMCRNFMKCYGDKYPPLFTCDNNKNIWGTQFCGLEVKSPEALHHLPEGCGVIICNIYYREIEAQLREMGISNIGYFNDEYMSSFYTDRV